MLGPFQDSRPLTLGVELELMLVNTRDFDLTRGADALLHALRASPRAAAIKPEITESMIELNTTVHASHGALLADLCEVRDQLVAAASTLNLGICGGGAHPFHRWIERRIFPTERFARVSALYGYLAKQFTVFGQHVHIGCASGDDAIRLAHGLACHVPDFIVLASSSPFCQGEETLFDTSRLHAVSAFPLAGHLPAVPDWHGFEAWFERMAGFGIVESMKDFYWDIRPRPEYGTVEVRVFDTPLDVTLAAGIAAYAQALACEILDAGQPGPIEDQYLVYGYNRFQACRFGFAAEVIDAATRTRVPLGARMLASVDRVSAHSRRLGSQDALAWLRGRIAAQTNGASEMRHWYAEDGAFTDVVTRMCARWCANG